MLTSSHAGPKREREFEELQNSSEKKRARCLEKEVIQPVTLSTVMRDYQLPLMKTTATMRTMPLPSKEPENEETEENDAFLFNP